MDNVLHFWITSFSNSEDQSFDEAPAFKRTEPIKLWDQDFADRHAKANATGNIIAHLEPMTNK